MNGIICLMKQSKIFKNTLRYLILALFSIYIFSIPYFSDRKPFNYVVYCIFILYSASVLTYYILFERHRMSIRPFLVLAFAIFASIGTVLLSHRFRILLSMFLLAVSYFVFYIMLLSINNTKLIIKLCVLSLVVFSLLFCIHYRNDLTDLSALKEMRLGEDHFYDDVNVISFYFASCSLLSLFLVFYEKKLVRFLFLVPFVFCLILGLFTASRGFIFSISISIAALFFIKFRKHPLVLIIFIALAILIVVLFFTIPIFSSMKSRLISMWNMLTGFGYSTDYSTATRVLWQDYAIYLGNHHIIFGNGLDGFYVFSGTGTFSHANIPEIICGTGIVGLIVYYLPVFFSTYDIYFKRFEFKPLSFVLIVFLVVRDFLSVTYTSKFNAFVFAIIVFAGFAGKYKKWNVFSDTYFEMEL